MFLLYIHRVVDIMIRSCSQCRDWIPLKFMSSQRKSDPWPCLCYSHLLSAEQHQEEFKIECFYILLMLLLARLTYNEWQGDNRTDEYWVLSCRTVSVCAGVCCSVWERSDFSVPDAKTAKHVSKHGADTQTPISMILVICSLNTLRCLELKLG